MTDELSPIEERIITLVLAGHTTRKELAAAVKRNEGWVRDRLSGIYRKTGVTNMAALILWALNHGYDLPCDIGSCDCGRPATRRVWLRVNRKEHEFTMCARCAALEVSE